MIGEIRMRCLDGGVMIARPFDRTKGRGLPLLTAADLLAERRPDRTRDVCGRHRSPATRPGYHLGRIPANKGIVYGHDYLRPAEVQALLDACPRHNPVGRRTYALIVLLWRSGARIHEALLLGPHDLDPDGHVVHIRRGKGGKPRSAQMDAWGFRELEAYMEFRRGYPPGPLFAVMEGPTKGVRAVGAPSVRVKLKEIALRAGVTRRIHPHIFRHTLAVELMKARYPLSYIQRALGHSNPATTATYLQGLGMDEGLQAVASRDAPEWAPAMGAELREEIAQALVDEMDGGAMTPEGFYRAVHPDFETKVVIHA